MSNRLSFYTHLSSIMEMMTKSALTQVCKLVEEDSADLRSELSRVLGDNAALTERLHSLECELTIRSEVPKLSKNCRTIGVQAGDIDCCVIEDPTIEGIFGKEWCMNLWKDRDPYILERVIHSTQCSDKSATPLSGPVDVTVIKEEDYEENIETLKLNIGENEDCADSEAGGPSIEYSLDDDSTGSLSFDQEEESSSMPAGGLGEHCMRIISIDGTEGEYDTHLIPVVKDDEEDDQDGDIQLIEESQKEPSATTAGEPTNNEQQTPGNYKNNTSPKTGDDLKTFNLPTTSDTNQERFTCHVCSRTFFHKSSLTNHMKSHKSSFCQMCKQHFPVRSKAHICVPPVHSQGSHHSCDLCGKVFANPSAVRVHYVVHTGEKPHVCNLCGKRFTQKGNLKCHLRIHTGERPFRCVACGKTFTQKVNLNHHLMAHRNSVTKMESTRNRKPLMKTTDVDRSAVALARMDK